MRTQLLMLGSEIYKGLLLVWSYKFSLVTQLITVMLIFIGASFFLGNGQFHTAQLVPLLLGYVVWFYARLVIEATGTDLMRETQAGTLEQMYMSYASSDLLLLGRMLALLISATAMVLIGAIVLIGLLGISIPLRWQGLPVVVLSLIGLFGFTLALAGAAFVFKQVEPLSDLMQNLLLFLSGALLPIDRFPAWLAAIARGLPITQGIVVLRHVVLQRQSLGSAWVDHSMFWLILNSLAYLLCGWLVFKWCERIARQRGSLGHY